MPYYSRPPRPYEPDPPFGTFDSRVTYYAPGPGDRMEGGFETSKPNPQTGKRVPSTLDDVRLGKSPFVTLAGDPSRYGQTVNMGPLTYTSPIDRKSYTLPSVTGYVHDTGSAFRGRPDKLDVATGDFRGWSPQAASSLVTADAGRRQVTPLSGDDADRAIRPIGLPEPWRATGAGESPTEDTAIAQGPPQQGRKMPTSLMDMFQPQDATGQPTDLGGALQARSNSLIGLGLGLLQPSRPGESAYTNALRGYMGGAAQDSTQGYRQAQLAHQKTQEGRQAANDAFQRQQALLDRDLKERQFARGDITDAQRAMRDVLGPEATPEQKSAFMKQYYLPKTEGDWQITKLPHPTIPGDEITVERNKRTGETRLPQYPGAAGAAAADPFTAGIGQPVYGGGGNYSAPQAAPQAAPDIPSSPSTAAPAGYRWGAVNPESGRRELVPIEGGPATKLPEGAASKLAMLEAAKPGLEEAKKYFLDPRPLHLREGGDQAGGALYSMGKQYLGEKTGSFEIGRQRRNIRYGIEAALRAATGAAAPETEVERYTDMYAPSITDSYATRKQKIEALDRFITTYEEAATRGHGGKPASKPAAPSADGIRRYNPETGKIE